MRTVLASSNPGKLRELSALLEPLGVALVSQNELGIEGAEETGCTFIENALEKARYASLASGLPAIADDSGLCVDVLGGAPGVFSARYAGANATDSDNNRQLQEALQGHDRPAAHYYCVIAYLRSASDPTPLIATGRWDGTITAEPRGSNGFGYDPYFLLGDGQTAAELSSEVKNRVSHRGQAVTSLVALLRSGAG